MQLAKDLVANGQDAQTSRDTILDALDVNIYNKMLPNCLRGSISQGMPRGCWVSSSRRRACKLNTSSSWSPVSMSINAMNIPPHLMSSTNLIGRAFPDGVSEADYLPLLAVLYPHMADENLAEVVSLLTGRDRGVVLNNVYAAGAGLGLNPAAVAAVRTRLASAGLDEWALED
ncbi:hypothetical protein [Myxococcus sp. Y35]|uniref:hypothetical protein n=1 Tax=Pseudomyxococcus flavus TaxID=3115648 RepID=UPI003CF127DB